MARKTHFTVLLPPSPPHCRKQRQRGRDTERQGCSDQEREGAEILETGGSELHCSNWALAQPTDGGRKRQRRGENTMRGAGESVK